MTFLTDVLIGNVDMLGGIDFWALDKFMQFWELKWPPFGHLGVASGKGWWRKMRIRPEHNFGQMARQHSFWAMGQFIHFWELKWPTFGHFWSNLGKIATMLIPIDTCIIVRGNSKIYFWCIFWGIFLGWKISKSKILSHKKLSSGNRLKRPKKIILSEIGKISIFDRPNLGVQTHQGSK